jgi:polygalacturonase
VIRIKTERGRGGYVKNCWFKDIAADTIEQEAIRVNMLYHGGNRMPAREVNAGTPDIGNLHYENIQCDYAKRNVIQIVGIPEMPVNNVTLKNINLGGRTGIEISDAKNITLEGLSIFNEEGSFAKIAFCDSIAIDNIEIIGTDESEVPFIMNDVVNSSLENVRYNLKGDLVQITGRSENIKIDKSIPENRIYRDAK